MVYKYVVFDWDGTLADTYPVLSAAYDYAFTKLNMPSISYDEVKRITSTLQNRDTLGCMFGEKKEEAAKYFYEYIEKHHTEKLLPFDGAKDVLEYCKNSGKLIYLIINKSKQYIHDEIHVNKESQILDFHLRRIYRNIWYTYHNHLNLFYR